jgi:hypothetical protein
MARVLWSGVVDDVEVRIVGSSAAEFYVEEQKAGQWSASDDELASHAYAQAFLECRSTLERLYDRDMGNLRLKEGVDVLTDAGRLLGRDG